MPLASTTTPSSGVADVPNRSGRLRNWLMNSVTRQRQKMLPPAIATTSGVWASSRAASTSRGELVDEVDDPPLAMAPDKLLQERRLAAAQKARDEGQWDHRFRFSAIFASMVATSVF